MNVFLATLAVLAAAYVHLNVSRFTTTRASTVTAHLVLAVVGSGFGYVAAITAASESLSPVVAFVMGFGAVHVPAALILLLKAARRAGL